MRTELLKSIYIPSPCHEKWDEMTQEAQGKHCRSCNKTVYDFTKALTEDMQLLLTEQNGNICGRFYEDEISHGPDCNSINQRVIEEQFSELRRWASMLIIFFTLKLSGLNKIYGQSSPTVIENKGDEPNGRDDSKKTIRGRIVDQYGHPVSLIEIHFLSERKKILAKGISKEDGSFLIPFTAITNDRIIVRTEKKKIKGRRIIKIYDEVKTSVTLQQEVIISIKRRERRKFPRRRVVMGRVRHFW